MSIGALCLALLVLGAGAVDGQDTRFEATAAEMGLELLLPPGAVVLPVVEPSEIDYQLAFAYPEAKYEVRCALHPLSGLRARCPQLDPDDYVPAFALDLFASIAGEDLCYSQMSELPQESLSREFGADYGLTALLKGGNCAFSLGYGYVVVNLLYRKGTGVAVAYILYNEPADLQMDGPRFAAAYYCFRFGLTVPPPAR